MFRVVTIPLFAAALSRAMPGLVALLFAISQISAMVDLPTTATLVQARPLPDRAALGAIAVLSAGLTAGPVLHPLVYGAPRAFVWTLPLTEARLVGLLALPAAMAALPAGIVGLLLGPLPAITVLGLGALAGLGWVARSPVLVGCTTLLGATAGLGALAPVGLLAGPLLAGRLGRALRDGRPRGEPRPWTLWRRGGPIGALVKRDLLALWRVHPREVAGTVVLTSLVPFLIQRTLHATWAPGSVATGALLLVGACGALPAIALAAAARIEQHHLLDRGLPVSAPMRVAGLLGTASAAIAPVTLAVLAGGTGLGLRSTLAAVALALGFSGLAVHALVRQPSQQRREELVSHGVFASVFATLAAAFVPGGLALVVGLAGLGLAHATLRVRPATGAV